MAPKCLLVLAALMMLSLTGSSQFVEPDVVGPFISDVPTVVGDTQPMPTAEAPIIGDSIAPGYTVMLDSTTGDSFLVAENGTRIIIIPYKEFRCGPCCCGKITVYQLGQCGFWEVGCDYSADSLCAQTCESKPWPCETVGIGDILPSDCPENTLF